MRPVMSRLTVAAALILWLAACGAATADTTAPTTEPPSTSPPDTTVAEEPVSPTLHTAPTDATLVWGTAACDFAEDGTDPDGGRFLSSVRRITPNSTTDGRPNMLPSTAEMGMPTAAAPMRAADDRNPSDTTNPGAASAV